MPLAVRRTSFCACPVKCNAYFIGAKPISLGSGSNFNPQNTQCIPSVKIFAFLELEPRLNVKCVFNRAGKNEHFAKVSEFLYDNHPFSGESESLVEM